VAGGGHDSGRGGGGGEGIKWTVGKEAEMGREGGGERIELLRGAGGEREGEGKG